MPRREPLPRVPDSGEISENGGGPARGGWLRLVFA